MQILNGNNLDLLKTLPDNSVDSIVTDPPYGLSFMNKKWDYDVPSVELWKEVYRVLKHGGHVLSFGGTRTYHRMVVNIEDAGFEIRDQIMWLYGSGFPKSLNIGKAIDKRGGESIGWFIDYILDFAEEKGISKKDLTMLFPSKNGNPTGWLWNKQHNQSITLEQYNTIKDFLGLDFPTLEEAKREIVGVGKAGLTKGNIATFSGDVEFAITAPSTEQAKKWEGWGTALKPANEPICLARKPLSEKSVAENVLKHGTGGINIDGCRVNFQNEEDRKESTAKNQHEDFGTKPMTNNNVYGDYSMIDPKNYDPTGRFPANIILDEEAGKLLDEQSGILNKQGVSKTDNKSGWQNKYVGGNIVKPIERKLYLDNGGASRFFYCAKASKSDRDDGCGNLNDKHFQMPPFADEDSDKSVLKNRMNSKSGKNHHPTVKPTDLMRYLCRLITPPNGMVLDPFMGSGSTGKGAILEGFDFIGMELDPEYVEIAKARIEHAQKEYKQNQSQQKLF
jgi:DNA modification methylase